MRCNELTVEDDAVSPVIGVILMVAITVILAAVVGVFVLESSPGSDKMPQASLDAEEHPDAGTDGFVNVTIRGGSTIDTSELEAIGGSGIDDGDVKIVNDDARLRAGQSISIKLSATASSGDEIILRWSPEGSDETRIFYEHKLSADWNP
jgi:flagellin-like protein